MKLQLLSTDRGLKSRSLRAVAQEMSTRLGYRVLRTTQPRADRVQFRYGSQVNKLDQYKWFKAKGLSSLVFTQSRAEAQDWVNQGLTVFGRKTLTGSNGVGIEIYDAEHPDVGNCLVYTQYKKKKREFRVHIFRNRVVAIVEKRKKGDHEGPSDPRVRNLANGYVFCQTVELTAALKKRIEEVALKASMVCSRSDFRGVDLCYNEHSNDVFIVEVNSAPGIEGTNVQTYCNAIQQVLH